MADLNCENENELKIAKNHHLAEDIDEDMEEKEHFQRIVNSFRYYRTHAIKRVLHAILSYDKLPPHHRALIPDFKDHLRKVKACIEHNYEVIIEIIHNTDHIFENKNHGPEEDMVITPALEFDMDKVRSTLRQFARDWSSEGLLERQACYGPVIREILERYPNDKYDPSEIAVLVPGAGLGRLTFEIARLGYICQGNEFSLFMLFASNFVLNRCREVEGYTLYPWVSQYCNNKKTEDQLRPARFPDVNPSCLPENAQFSMAAGDFLEVYTEPNIWDCVATVFFIDTAHNIMAYIETIYKILKPGGYWINLGPLLYHFADLPNETSIELSYEDLRDVILKFNFEILKEDMSVPCYYTQNQRSMLKNQYECVFFVARKPNEPTR